MMARSAIRSSLLVTLTVALLAGTSIGVSAQDESQAATVADILAGLATGEVRLDGAALAQDGGAADEYWFSDGTDVIKIVTGGDDVPLLTLISVVGTAADDGIDVSGWEVLDVITPAVIRTPQEAAEAFFAWIITQNSQAAVD